MTNSGTRSAGQCLGSLASLAERCFSLALTLALDLSASKLLLQKKPHQAPLWLLAPWQSREKGPWNGGWGGAMCTHIYFLRH